MSDPCARASSQYANGDIPRALSNITRCQKDLQSKLRKFRTQPEIISQIHLQLARAYRFEGQIYFGEQNTGKAHSAFTSALQSVKKAGSSKEIVGLRGQIRYSLAIIALIRKQVHPALDLLETAKEDFIEAGMGNQGLEVMMRLGSLHRDMGQFDLALSHFREVHKNRKQADDKTQQRIYNGRSKLEEARILHRQGDNSADKCIKQAMKEFRKAKFYEGAGEALLARAAIHEAFPDKAREYLLEAKELAEGNELPQIAGVALTKLGVIALKSGDFDKGKTQLLAGLKFRTEAGDTVGTAQTLVELSRITLITARNEHDLKTATTFADQALGLYSKIDNKYGRASTLELLGSIHTKLGNLDLAKQQVQEGKSIYAEYDDLDGEARMLTQMGMIYGQEERQEQARTVLEKAISTFEKTGNRQGLAEALHVSGTILAASDPQQAKDYLTRSRDLYEIIIGNNKEMQIILKSIDNTITALE